MMGKATLFASTIAVLCLCGFPRSGDSAQAAPKVAKITSLKPQRLRIWMLEHRGKRELLAAWRETDQGKNAPVIDVEFLSFAELLQRLTLEQRSPSPKPPDIIEFPSRFFRFAIEQGFASEIPRDKTWEKSTLAAHYRASAIGNALETSRTAPREIEESHTPFATCLATRAGQYRVFGAPFLFKGQPLIINQTLMDSVYAKTRDAGTFTPNIFETWRGLAQHAEALHARVQRAGVELSQSDLALFDLASPEHSTATTDDPFWILPVAFNYGAIIEKSADTQFREQRKNLVQALIHLGALFKQLPKHKGISKTERGDTPGKSFLANKLIAYIPADLAILASPRWGKDFFAALPPRGIDSNLIVRNALLLSGSNIAITPWSRDRTAAFRAVESLMDIPLSALRIVELSGQLPALLANKRPSDIERLGMSGIAAFLGLVERNGRFIGYTDAHPAPALRYESALQSLLRDERELGLSPEQVEKFVDQALLTLSGGIKR